MNWKKKTNAEIDQIVATTNDSTAGYEWAPWLWYMRRMHLVGLLANVLVGFIGGLSNTDGGTNMDLASYVIIGLFGIAIPTLIAFLLRRDYKEGKLGKSR